MRGIFERKAQRGSLQKEGLKRGSGGSWGYCMSYRAEPHPHTGKGMLFPTPQRTAMGCNP